MSEYKIIKGAPIPPKRVSAGRVPKYPFAGMEIGDAVDVDSSNGVASARGHGKAYGKSFISRKKSDGTFRIWRVA
jgi:hypothetical protein